LVVVGDSVDIDGVGSAGPSLDAISYRIYIHLLSKYRIHDLHTIK